MRSQHQPTVHDYLPAAVGPLLSLSDEELAQLDIAKTNLACADGLPGAEDLDVPWSLAKLDDWAALIEETTRRYLPRFRRTPAEFDYSEARFRILCMVTVLQRDLGVRYNPDFVEGPYNATDSRTHFIHGPLTGFGGTCVNLPVLYIRVGRRLGHPLKLLRACEHYFVRWTGDDGERFNIEATSKGFTPHDDEHFQFFPKPLGERELASGYFLRDMKPREELACFLAERANVLRDNLRMPHALAAWQSAYELHDFYDYQWALTTVMARIHRNLHGRIPNTDAGLVADLELATPSMREPWARSLTLKAQDELFRICKLLRAKRKPAAPLVSVTTTEQFS